MVMSQNIVTLKRSLTRWLVRQRIGKSPATTHYHWEIVKSIRRIWREHLLKPPEAITDDDVTTFALRAGHYSPSRWNGMLTVLHAVVPAARALKRRTPKLTRKPPPNQEEFARLLSECDRLQKSKAGLVVAFLAHTGLRIGGAKRLLWSDVYPERIEYISKGGGVCSVPIVAGLRDVLDRLRAIDDGSGYVLPRAAIRKGLSKACANAGIRPLTHHDFRHMFSTRCIESGVDVPTLARWLGHQDGGALLSKRYFHLLDAHSKSMAAKVRI